MSDLKTTPLRDLHVELGGKMVPFAGYEMPVQYPLGVMKEHLHTRSKAGLFDVSHMGQVIVYAGGSYEAAALAMEKLVPVNLAGLGANRQRYGFFTNDEGGILDDSFVLDTNTWRANPDWGQELGHDLAHLRAVNEEAVASAMKMRREFGQGLDVLINGVIGPRGDGYDPKTIMSVKEAQKYHGFQIATFVKSGVDMVSALTITNVPEAIGVANAAAEAGVPCVISFTLETDGCLPTGEMLGDAITQVDAQAKAKPAYFMINCAHPDHFADMLPKGADWTRRIVGVRANASRMSHAELDCCETLDDGDPVELGAQYQSLRQMLPNLKVFGGCCGTDHRHLSQICKSIAA